MNHSRIGRLRWAHHGIALIAGVLGVIGLYHLIQHPRIYTVIIDASFSPAARVALHTLCKELPHHRLDPYAVRTILQHAVTGVHHVTIDERRSTYPMLIVTAARPLMLINTGLVLTENAHLTSTTEYTTTALEQLPHITVNESEINNITRYMQFFTQIPADIFKDYYLTWNDPTYIKLTPRSTLSLEFSIWHQTIFSPPLLRAMKYLPTLLHPSRDRKGVRSIWHIDARVPTYLIVSHAVKEHS